MHAIRYDCSYVLRDGPRRTQFKINFLINKSNTKTRVFTLDRMYKKKKEESFFKLLRWHQRRISGAAVRCKRFNVRYRQIFVPLKNSKSTEIPDRGRTRVKHIFPWQIVVWSRFTGMRAGSVEQEINELLLIRNHKLLLYDQTNVTIIWTIIV